MNTAKRLRAAIVPGHGEFVGMIYSDFSILLTQTSNVVT
jgi:hypothetical protein